MESPAPQHALVSLTADDTARVVELEDHVWFEISYGVSPQDLTEILDWTRSRGVERAAGGTVGAAPRSEPALAGMYTAWGFGLSVPGVGDATTQVPMSALTWVGVHQDERRRGLLRAMMTDHLHGIHEAGREAIAGLHASEPGIYGRFGYGLATYEVALTFGRGTEFRAPAAVSDIAGTITTHMVPADSDAAADVVHRVQAQAAGLTLGAVTRPADLTRRWFRDHPSVRREKEPLQVLIASTPDGVVTGAAVFRRQSKWSDAGIPEGEVLVRELIATDAPTLLALGRRLVDFDLTGTVKVYGRPIDDPLVVWAGGPRGRSPMTGDSLWIRLVDVDKALKQRGYASPVDVVLDVEDELCPWNAGRWRLHVDADGSAACERAGDDAPTDLTVPVQALGAAYAGGTTIAALAAAGLITEHTPGATRALSRAMRGDVEPVPSFGF